MAKKKQTDPKAETAARIKRTEAYAERVRALFAATVNQILALNKTIPTLKPGEMFSFDAQSLKKQNEVERLLRQLHSVATMAIQQGITLEWGQANAAADNLVKSVFGQAVLSSPEFKAWGGRNGAAMQAFINRSEKGLSLSDRVWQAVRQLREEMEVAITISVGEGQSAQKMSQSVRQYLNDPDLMFRRFRYKAGEEIEYDEDGNEIGKKIIWGRKWKKRIKKPDGTYGWIDYDRNDYKTGAGVYKSSAKNAMRVARTETNIAYRRADHQRWQAMDFVIGQRVSMSKDHPKKDICDKLAGDYPKDFVFDGWHPQCFCYVTPITIPPEETAKLTEMMLAGEDWRGELARLKRGREITSYPDNFKSWVRDNADNIQAARDRGTEPYFIRNNARAINNIINPPKALTPREIADQRHAARTDADKQKILNAWQERKERIEAEKKASHITAITSTYGNRILDIMGDIPGVDTTALRAAIKAGDTTLIQDEAKKLRDLGKQFKADAHLALGTASDYGEISGANLQAAIKAGNIKSIWEQTKALQSQIKATQADEAALETLIPNAHDWHKKFTSTDLHAVYDNVEKKLTSLSGLSLAEQKKKLEFEMSYVASPGTYKPGAKQYPTWEVAQNAYGKALADVNYKIAIENITNQLKIVEAWSLAHPKSKNVANYLLEAKNSILNKEPLPIIQTKAQKAILEHQKRLAEQARRDAKITGAVALNDITDTDRAKLYDDFENKLTVDSVDQELRKDTKAAWPTLNPEEQMLCTKYTQSYCYLNEPLRNMTYSGGRGSAEYANDMPKLTKALQKVKTQKDMVVRRGTDDYKIPELGKYLSAVVPGDEFTDGAFLSTACHPTKGFFYSLNLIIYVPKGAEGIFAEPFTHYNDSGCYNYSSNLWDGKEKKSIGGEFEWIGQRGSRFRVISKTGSTIHLLMIGQRFTQPIK